MPTAIPDSFGEQQLVFAQGSRTVLLPDPVYGSLMWRIHFDGGVTEPAFGFMNFDIRVVDDLHEHMMVEVSFSGQTSFPTASYAGYPTAQAYFYSKAGDLIAPSPLRFTANLYAHQANIPFRFALGPLQDYPLDQIGKVRLEGLNCDADLN